MVDDPHFTIPAHAIARRIGDETVILDLSGGEYLSLNSIGSRVWELLVDGLPQNKIVDTLSSEYDAPRETIQADVESLIEQMLERRLINEDP